MSSQPRRTEHTSTPETAAAPLAIQQTPLPGSPLPLIQIAPRRAPQVVTDAVGRKPPWLKVKAPGGPNYAQVRHVMQELKLTTVCEEAHCPNVGECWEHRAATFMILGDVCTRNCAYCAVAHGTPRTLDVDEPRRLAEAVAAMGLKYIVVTSVDRDDLPNGGAEQFADVVKQTRLRLPDTAVELLIPDFKGNEAALRIVVEAKPDILNHNLETVRRLYRLARPGGRYDRALELLARAKTLESALPTKSGLMVGLGEEWEELLTAMRDLRGVGVDLLTIGQYLRPSAAHLPVARFYTPDEFADLRRLGLQMGYRHVESGPLVRSSYHAWEQAERAMASF
ncbi:MAG TPA: lipoyl synthase [Gemmatimonadales bacterium]|nr:lipoyl synthase [Gemmatimonadales bacterium]